MTKQELEQLVLSQQETINQLTKLLEQSEKRRGITIAPPNWDTFKYSEMMKPTCAEGLVNEMFKDLVWNIPDGSKYAP